MNELSRRSLLPALSPDPVQLQSIGYHHSLPPHILAFEQVLEETHRDVEAFRHQADGLIGPIGLDAIIGMVPVLGAFYTAYGGFKLLGCAGRAKCGFGTRFTGFVLTGIDLVIGVVVGLGDVIDAFLRSHAIYAGMIRDEIRTKLIAIEQLREHGHNQGYLTGPEIAQLENTLYRGGRSEGFARVRTLLLIGAVGLVLYSCVAGG